MDEKLYKKVYDWFLFERPTLSLYSFIVLLGVVFTNLPLFFYEYSKITSKPYDVYSLESRKNIFCGHDLVEKNITILWIV